MNRMRSLCKSALLLPLFCAFALQAQLFVTVEPPKIVGQKAVIPLMLRNSLPEKVQSARAVVFLVDKEGKVAGQAARWVIGGTNTNGLPVGATNTFHFVVNASKSFASTNLTAKVTFTEIVLEGGKQVDPARNVEIVK
jgi:hypothetical protein